MGYYTNFSLEIVKGNDYETDYESEIGEISEYGSSTFEESIKWYDHEKHMRQYSLLHPEVLFKLSGDGEENGDIWAEYYSNGKMQRVKARIVIDDFDETKLV